MILRAVTVAVLPFVAFVPGQVSSGARPAPPAPRALTAALATEIEPRTKIEALLATPGTVLSADYYHVETHYGTAIQIDAVVVTAVESQTSLRGMRVQVHGDDKPGGAEGASFLDFDEIPGFSAAVASLTQLATNWTGHDELRDTDLSYTTPGGLRVAIHQSGHLQRVFLSAGLVEPVVTSLELTDLSSLKQAADQALTILKNR